jgi:hypothetical protein
MCSSEEGIVIGWWYFMTGRSQKTDIAVVLVGEV